MSYLDFERGVSAESLRRQREVEASERLRAEMTQRWRESERILGILRTIGALPEDIPGMDEWFSRVRKLGGSDMDHEQRTPNEWFQMRFPDAVRQFGRAFFNDTRPNLHGAQVEIPLILNEDFFAAILAGEKRLGHRMVHCPGDGFWFYDPRVDAFCATSDSKVELLLSNYLVKCGEALGRGVDASVLVKDHRRPSVLAGIVNRSKTVLEAHPRFFEGSNAARKYANGRVLQPTLASAPQDFIHNAFKRSEGGSVIVGEAYQEFLRYCQMGNLTRVEFTEFKRVAKELVLEKFQLGLRHDIRTTEGRQTHGWKHIRLLPDPSGQAIDAA
ncbi:MAG: hypothetical protein ORN83_16475 [Chthoniobacteraceae bacterium]|nr:hypothetical protein [Chthoniobacteraceae bacterium]